MNTYFCTWSVIRSSTSEKPKLLYILDGSLISEDKFAKIKPDKIKSIEVIKNLGNSDYSDYAKDGIEGVIVIISK